MREALARMVVPQPPGARRVKQEAMLDLAADYLILGLSRRKAGHAAAELGVCRRSVERYRALAKRAGLL